MTKKAKLKAINDKLEMFYLALGHQVVRNQFMINEAQNLLWEREKLTRTEWKKAARCSPRR